MAELFKNNVSATLASSITATSVTIDLASGDGAQFPVIASGTANTFRISLWDKSGNVEIISICRRESGSDTLYVGTGTSHQAAGNVAGRGMESTTALAITSSDYHVINMNFTAAQAQAALEASSLDGLTSTVTELNVLDADNRTVGDLITETTAGTMGAIAAVAATQYLKSAGVATLPAYGKLALSDTGVKIGTTSIVADTTGATVITGVGFSPSAVIILAISGTGCSVGVDDGTTHGSISFGETAYTSGTTYSYLATSTTGYCRGTISAKGADGFTLTTSANTSDSATTIIYLALP